MKAALALFMVLSSVCGWGQTTIFRETMGTGASGNPIATNYTGFSNYSTLTYRGDADVRNTSPSSYSGASEGNNVFITDTRGRYFTISGINTSTYNSLGLSFGFWKSSALTSPISSSQFIIEFATDYNSATNTGTFTSLTYPTITTGSAWSLVTVSGGSIPSSTNLAIRFRQDQTTAQIRIDDVTLKGIPTPTGPTVSTFSANLVSPVGSTLNGTINANSVSTDASFDWGETTAYGSTITATPATVTGSTPTAISADLTGLAVNTQYNYRAVGKVGTAATNGADATFWTLANTPGAVTVNNPQLTTLNVTLNADGNPPTTVYAIYETSTAKYVQANGSLGATPAWQTRAAWGTKTVTGLAMATTYTFQAKARNGANVETALSTSASGTTGTPPTVDKNVVQWPNTTQNVTEGNVFTVYIRAYEPGVTETNVPSPRLKAWVGYSTTNNHPENSDWTWVSASFNVHAGDNDEYQANIPANVPGTYFYAARFEMDNAGVYTYGGSNGNWNGDNVQLNVLPDVVDFANIQHPHTATIFAGNRVTVYAQVYEPGVTEAAGQGAGISAEIGYSSTNGTPDQTWTWLPAIYNEFADNPGNNDEYMVDIGANLSAGTYYYASRFRKSTSNTYQYGGTGGVWNNNSGVLTVGTLGVPTATAATNITPVGLTANWNAVTGAESYILEVYELTGSVTPNVTVVGWEFEDQNISADTGVSVNLTKSIAKTGGGTTSYVAGYNGAATGGQAISAGGTNAWSGGSGSKYWEVSFETTGFANMSLSSAQMSSGTGPRDFKVQYKIGTGGTYTDVPNTSITVGDTSTNWIGTLMDVSLPVACDDQPLIYLRWIMTSNSGVNGSNVGTSGTSRIDNVIVTGDQGTLTSTPVSDPPLSITAPVTSYNVTGLNPASNYTYTVKAVKESASSAAGNSIAVTTLGTPTWNGGQWSYEPGPDATMPAIIDGDYSIDDSFEAKSLTVNAGKTLTVNTFVKTGDVTNNGHIIVANNANFVQTGTFNAVPGSTFIVNRDSKPVQRLDYISWSSPMKTSTQSLKAFSPDTLDNRFMTYNNGTYTAVTNPAATTFVAAQGYLIRTPNNYTTEAQVFNGIFNGTEPNSGTLTYNASGITGKYVFLGNPYPSAISMEDFYTANPGISGTFYIWDSIGAEMVNNVYSGSNYVTYTAAGSNPGGSASFVPVAQGFFVDRVTDNNGITSFKFNNNMRRTVETGTFAKGVAAADRFWLQMDAPSGARPQLLIGFFDNAGAGYDAGYDGKMFGNNSDVLYSTVDNQALVINALGTFTDTQQISVTAKFLSAGTYTLGLEQKEGIFSETQKIWLKDHLTGTVTDLTAGNYSFTAIAGVQANRFTVQFVPGAILGTDGGAKSDVTIFSSGSDIHIRSSQKIREIEVYEMSGKLIAASTPTGTETVMPVSYKGAVVVKVTQQNGNVQTRKLILN